MELATKIDIDKVIERLEIMLDVEDNSCESEVTTRVQIIQAILLAVLVKEVAHNIWYKE